MVRSGPKSKGRVIDCVTEPLNRPIEIGRSRVHEEKVIETFRYQSPAANERIAQDQGRVVPDKTVAHRRRIADEDKSDQD